MDGFFLGANTPHGFYSLYDEELSGCAVKYILKGSPGCGKSTLMKTVCDALSKVGLRCEKIYCASDPNSLDAVICGHICIADGTAPHVAEPKYAGACEYYVNLGDCCRPSAAKERERIVRLSDAYREEYSKAYPLLCAAGKVRTLRLETAGAMARDISRRAAGIALREFGKSKKGAKRGRIQKRFISAICHDGIVNRFDHAAALCPKVYAIESEHSLGTALLTALRELALTAGHDVVCCPSPMAPHGKEEHLLIPSLALAFISADKAAPLPLPAHKHIHADRYMEKSDLSAKKSELKRLKKSENELILQATEHLNRAFILHEELEAVYRPHMDFDAVAARAKKITEEILQQTQF